MDDKHYRALLEAARVSQDGPWATVMEDRTITLHVASGGVGLNIGKVVRLRSEGLLLHAENTHGEVFVLSLGDVFAASIDGGKKAGRKAGFATCRSPIPGSVLGPGSSAPASSSARASTLRSSKRSKRWSPRAPKW